MPFQQRYASLILELERINRDLNEYLIGVQQYCHEVIIIMSDCHASLLS